jgi:hypothetical protein
MLRFRRGAQVNIWPKGIKKALTHIPVQQQISLLLYPKRGRLERIKI